MKVAILCPCPSLIASLDDFDHADYRRVYAINDAALEVDPSTSIAVGMDYASVVQFATAGYPTHRIMTVERYCQSREQPRIERYPSSITYTLPSLIYTLVSTVENVSIDVYGCDMSGDPSTGGWHGDHSPERWRIERGQIKEAIHPSRINFIKTTETQQEDIHAQTQQPLPTATADTTEPDPAAEPATSSRGRGPRGKRRGRGRPRK